VLVSSFMHKIHCRFSGSLCSSLSHFLASVLQTDNQEDRRLYEEASVRLYDATPDADVAKRHGLLKAKINGKM